MGLTQITTGGVDDNINIDSNTLKVDGTNNRVGIGTSSPNASLTVDGGTRSFATSGITLKRTGTLTGSSDFILAGTSGSEALSVRVNDTERMRIDSSGDLSVPRAASGYMFQTGNSVRAGIRSNDQNELIFKRGTDTTGMVLTSTGLGIGTTSPGALLNLQSTTSASLRIKNTTNSTPSVPHIELLNNNNEGLDITINRSGVDSRAKFAADTAISVETGGSERMRIDSSGRVGIGTTSPGVVGLHVRNSSEVFLRLDHSGTNTWDISNDSNLKFARGGTEHLRIDSSGDVRIQAASPLLNLKDTNNDASSSVVSEVQGRDSADTIFWRLGHLSTGNQSLYLYNQRSDSLLFGTAGTEQMRIDSSGRLLVGTSSSRAVGGNITGKLQIEGTGTGGSTTACTVTQNSNDGTGGRFMLAKSRGTSNGSVTLVQSGDTLGMIDFAGADGTDAGSSAVRISAQVDGTPGSNDMPGRLVFSTTADGASSPTERMRIDSSGDLKIGQTTTSTPAGDDVRGVGISGTGVLSACNTGARAIEIGRTETDSLSREVLRWFRNGSLVQTITTTSTTVNYPTGSDYRLKENVIEMTGAINRVKQLSPKRFNFIAEPGVERDGFIAHELETVVPQAVVGTKDQVDENGNPVWQGVDHSFMVPLLTGALQEAIAKIETLETKVAALEAAE